MHPALLITGASAGIGRELALQAPFEGHVRVLVARSEDKLTALAAELIAQGRRAEVVVLDLEARDAGARLEAALQERGLMADILVNNAGFGLAGAVADIPIERQLALIDLNVRASTELTLRCLPGMIARGRGGILNVGSISGFVPGPYMATYYASKAFLRSFSEALWQETRGTGVRVTLVAPGPVSTDFLYSSGAGATRLFKLLPKISAEAVARAAWAGFEKDRRLVLPDLYSRLIATGSALLPHALTVPFVAATQRPKRRPHT